MKFGQPSEMTGESIVTVYFPVDPPTIFDLLCDPDAWDRIMGKDSPSIRSTQSIGIGTQLIDRFGPFGIYKMTRTLTEYDRPRRFVRNLRGSIISDVEYNFEPTGEGTTVTVKFKTMKVPWPRTGKQFHESQREVFESLRSVLEKGQ